MTIPDRYPIPEINEVLAQLGKNNYFSVIDLKSGFHQIPLEEKDVEKTAFKINNGKYEFLRLPFGLRNAPSIFQRALDDILRDHIGKICYVYIDDIIVFSKDPETHFENLRKIFLTLQNANMKVQLDKCEFLKTEVEFLGFIVSSQGIKTNPKKVETIMNFPHPKTLKDLRSFLGLSGFYRRFIKDYAKLAKPLTSLLRGEDGRTSKSSSSRKIIHLNQDAIEAFNKIKKSLVTDMVMLTYPDYKKDFHLTTDASDYAIGAVLAQDGKPIIFISRTLSKAEEHYAANEKEMLAIVWSLNTLRNYLYGSAKIQIFTDHQPLTYALSNKNTNNKMKRWKAILEEYNYTLKYKPGKMNVVADALSRPPRESQINSMTATEHSDESSGENLIEIADEPLNVFKNQILINIGDASSYNFKIVFPLYHRHIITEPEFTEEKLVAFLKRHLNPLIINGLKTDERTLGLIQEVYKKHFSNYRIRFTRKILIDITDEFEQNKEIINEHKRAHRSSRENKIQLLQKFYFPRMQAKIEKVIKQCKICKEQKYDRHPNKPMIQATPIPLHPGHIVHVDLYLTDKKTVLTAIDKFSKYAQTKIVDSRAAEDLKQPLREILLAFGVPKIVVFDNERSFISSPITFMLENQFKIQTFTSPPYTNTANGQIERFHSTLSEIMRCIKSEKVYDSFSELLDMSVYEYNNSIHSTTNKKPSELFFGLRETTNPEQTELERQKNIARLKEKQESDLSYHNKNKTPAKDYAPGDQIFVRINKRLGNKLSPRYRKEIVKLNKNSVVISQSGKTIHKSLIKN